MPKKKQPHNAFYFFMLEYKARCERNGEHFPGGLKDVQVDAGAEWQVMPAKEKKKFEDQAKETKIQMKNDHTRKVTNMHNSFDSNDRRLQREEAERNARESWVTGILASLTRGGLAAHKFYVMHVNYFCISEGDCYHPAELAIAEFSLAQGVEDVLHFIFSPGTIPLGYRHDAMTKSESSHRIPLDGKNGERDYFKICKAIWKFLERGRALNGGEFPQLFTLPDNVNLNTSMSAVKNVLKMLSDTSGDDAYNILAAYPVYNLEYLFYRLKNSTSLDDAGSFSHIALAQLELEKDIYNYTGHIACQYHYDIDCVEHCSKSFVQRWVYLICDYCCQDLDIDLIPGKHVPMNAEVDMERRKQSELEKAVKPPMDFTWRDHSVAQNSSWAPREMEPVPRPSIKPRFGAAAAAPEPIDRSEENFPSIAIGRGRGRFMGRGGPPQAATSSFASVMKTGRR